MTNDMISNGILKFLKVRKTRGLQKSPKPGTARATRPGSLVVLQNKEFNSSHDLCIYYIVYAI